MQIDFEVRYTLGPKEASLAAGRVYGLFGLEAEQGERVYVEPFSLDVLPGQIVAFIGVSGAGKSSCLRQFSSKTRAVDIDKVTFDPHKPVVENLSRGVSDKQAIELASRCGLAEAQLLLRYPGELSDGQFYRFKIANALSKGYHTLVADEFLATLDREQAKVIAFNLRKLVTNLNINLAIATTHQDIIEDLAPDHLVTFDGARARVSNSIPKGIRSPLEGTYVLAELLAGNGNFSNSGTIEVRP